MIDVKVTTVGGPEIARQLEAGPGAIRTAAAETLQEWGDEVIDSARGLAPKKSGIMASRIVSYFGTESTGRQMRRGAPKYSQADRGSILFTVRPTGSVAHLIERGVHGPRKAHFRRELRVGTVWLRKGKKTIRNARGRTFVQAHPFKIAAHPFFMPAVESAGGAAGIGARLQAAMERAGEIARAA